MSQAQHLSERFDPEPRWPAFIAVLAVGGLYTALPEALIIGPRWMFFVVVVALLIPTALSHWKEYRQLNAFSALFSPES